MDVDDEIYILRNFGSASVAKEYVQSPLPFFAAVGRDPQRLILTINVSSEKSFRIGPHLNPLPLSGARRGAQVPG